MAVRVVGTAKKGGGGGGVPAGAAVMTDAVVFAGVFNLSDTMDAQADALALTGRLDLAESNPAPDDALAIDVTGPAFADSIAGQGEARQFTLRAGATTATNVTTAGSGWATPANAQGPNDAAVSTLNSAAGVGAANQAGTLTLAYASPGTLANESLPAGSYDLIAYYTLTVGVLATGSLTVEYSVNGGTNWTNLATHTATIDRSAGFTFATTGLTLASLPNLRVRFTGSVTGSATAAGTATVNAVVVPITTT